MYSWDHENHLTTIQKTNTSGELELVAEYVYDALGDGESSVLSIGQVVL